MLAADFGTARLAIFFSLPPPYVRETAVNFGGVPGAGEEPEERPGGPGGCKSPRETPLGLVGRLELLELLGIRLVLVRLPRISKLLKVAGPSGQVSF